eukprot:COSAG06_NODE_30397_length_539_cov_1.518182_1_plen_160_part_10
MPGKNAEHRMRTHLICQACEYNGCTLDTLLCAGGARGRWRGRGDGDAGLVSDEMGKLDSRHACLGCVCVLTSEWTYLNASKIHAAVHIYSASVPLWMAPPLCVRLTFVVGGSTVTGHLLCGPSRAHHVASRNHHLEPQARKEGSEGPIQLCREQLFRSG